MAVYISDVFLLTELHHLIFTMVNLVLVLVCNFDNLIIFLKYELRSFNFSWFVKVWQNEQFVKSLFSLKLSFLRKK